MRINDLARELEVKSGRIIEVLSDLGIEGKRSHSSSLEDDQVLTVRRFFEREAGARPSGPKRASEKVEKHDEEKLDQQEVHAAPASPPPPASRVATPPPLAPPAAASASTAPVTPRAATPPAARTRAVLRPPMRAAQPEPPPAPVAPTKPIAPPPAPVEAMPAAPPPPPPPVVVPPAAEASAPQATAEVVLEEPKPAPHMPRLPGQPGGPPRPGPSRFGRQSLLTGTPAAGTVPPGTIIRRADQMTHLTQPAPRPSGAPPSRPGSRPIYQRPGQSAGPGSPSARAGAPSAGGIAPGSRPMSPRPYPPRSGAPGGPGSATAPGARPYERRPMHPTRARPAGPPGVGVLPPPPGVLPPGPSRRARPAGGAAPVRDKERGQRRMAPPVREPAAALAPREINREIQITEGITVKDLAEKLGEKAKDVMMMLIRKGVLATINQPLDSAVATDLARHFGAEATTVSFEEQESTGVAETEKESPADMSKRPPVVTIMGHVDHGKTSLLDAIRVASVVSGEAGGITQHIGAYQVDVNGRKIAFIDTPGHEAFTRMRARGAKVTDIVVLVVAADDGVMPQTMEAIDHARAAKVPIIVAINKIDKPDSMPERVKKQLADRGLQPEDWGGDTVMVEVSAKQKTNLDTLLEMILLVADIQDLKANPNRPAAGTVLEAKLDRGRGPVATVLVQNGTLKVGDPFIVGAVFSKVRALMNERGEVVDSAGPATPVEVLGLASVPQAGDQFQVITDIIKAKQTALYREQKQRDLQMAASARVTLEQLHAQMKAGSIRELPVILKADVQGSAEVVSEALLKIPSDKVKVRIIRAGVGAITESDVALAMASNAVIIGFNVRPERKAQDLAEQEKVDIRLHTIIYNVTDEVKKALTGLLEPATKEVQMGRAEVRQTFRISKVGAVAGCYVTDGVLKRNAEARLVRDGVVVHTGKIGSLRRFKDEASEVRTGFECGVTLDNYSDLKPGDLIEAFMIEKVQETLTS